MRDNGGDSDASDSVVDLSKVRFFMPTTGFTYQGETLAGDGCARVVSQVMTRSARPRLCEGDILLRTGPSQGTYEHAKGWRPKGLESVSWRGRILDRGPSVVYVTEALIDVVHDDSVGSAKGLLRL